MSYLHDESWILYITYYNIDPKTGDSKSANKTKRFFLADKAECENKLEEFIKPNRIIVGYTMLPKSDGISQFLSK